MRYFEMTQSKNLKNVISLEYANSNIYVNNPTKSQFDNIPKSQVGYYQYNENVVIPDILERPTMFVSPEIKHVLEMYDDGIEYKVTNIFPFGMASQMLPTYWCFYAKEIDCLHSSAIVLPNGEIKEVILDSKKITDEHFFKLKNTVFNHVIVSLPVAESILRRKVFGVDIREVKVI